MNRDWTVKQMASALFKCGILCKTAMSDNKVTPRPGKVAKQTHLSLQENINLLITFFNYTHRHTNVLYTPKLIHTHMHTQTQIRILNTL